MFTHHAPEELLMDDGKDLNHYAKDKLHIVVTFNSRILPSSGDFIAVYAPIGRK